MIPRFPLLTTVAAEPLRLQQLHQQLRQHGLESQLRPVPALPCLRFELHGADGRATCLVAAHSWAARHLPGLEGLDWQHISDGQLAGLCAVQQPLQLPGEALRYHQAYFLGRAMIAPGAAPHPQLDSAEGAIWVEQLDWPWAQSTAPIEVSGQTMVPICLRLGTLRQSPARLSRLHTGDILLLTHPRLQAWRADRCLFEFALTLESVAVTTTYPTYADQPSGDTVREGERACDSIDLASLPLSCEVVLCTVQLSLAELADLGPGCTLKLPEHAYRRVQIEHNGHCVATGELVQVGDVLGIQLAQTPRVK